MDNYSHEVTYHKHKDLNYDIMKDEVIKTIITILLCGFLVICLTGCSKSEELEKPYIGEEATTEIATDKKIELSIKEGTLTDVGATIVLTNNSDEEYAYGEPYSIQIKKDGTWHVINVQRIFQTPMFHLKNGETTEIELKWDANYGKLESGTYRIIKNIGYECEKDKFEYFSIAVEFNIDD